MSVESDKSPHMSNTVSWGTILGFVVLLITQLGLYAAANREDGKREQVMNQLTQDSASHVVTTELDNRLALQEFKITTIAKDVKELKGTIKENQKMMIELLQRIPKRN